MPPKKGKSKKKQHPGRRRPGSSRQGSSSTGSQGRAWTVQPLVLGHQMNIGKIPLFPPRYKCSLRYADFFTLTSTSGAVGSYVISCNGLYDPDVTGTGHQPAGFDQMMASYEHYTVLRSRITATFHNTSTTAAGTIAISVNAALTPITVSNQILEDGLATVDRIGQFGVSNAIQTLQRSCDIARFGGVDNLLDDDNYRGTIAANPAESSYFIIQSWCIEAATFACSVEFVVEFEAIFTEPRKIGESLSRMSEERKVSERKVDEVDVLVPFPEDFYDLSDEERKKDDDLSHLPVSAIKVRIPRPVVNKLLPRKQVRA